MRHFPPEKKYFSHLRLSYFKFFCSRKNTFLKFQLNSLINFSILNRNASLPASVFHKWRRGSWIPKRFTARRVAFSFHQYTSECGRHDVGRSKCRSGLSGWNQRWGLWLRMQERKKQRNGLVTMSDCRGWYPDGEPDSTHDKTPQANWDLKFNK